MSVQKELKDMSREEKISYLKEMLSSGKFEDDALFNEIIADFRKTAETNDESDPSYESGADIMKELNDWMVNSPEGRRLKSNMSEKESLRNVMGLISSTADLFTSGRQIKEGEASQAAINKPVAPRRYQLDPNVSKSIRESIRGIDPAGIEGLINPAKQDVKETYQAGDNVAKVASGGQAGSYGSMAQANVSQRYDSMQSLAGLRNQIRESMLRNLNYSLQNRLSERQMQQQGDFRQYENDLEQYNTEQQAAGNLERAGRINRRLSINNLGNSILPIADNLIDDGSSIRNLANKLHSKKSIRNNNPTINDPASAKLPSTSFDVSNDFDGRNIDDIFTSNLIINPFRGMTIRR